MGVYSSDWSGYETDIDFGPGGVQSPYATKLDSNVYLGTTTGRKRGESSIGKSSTKRYDEMMSGPLTHSYDYSSLDPSLSSMLSSAFAGRSAGGRKYYESSQDWGGGSSHVNPEANQAVLDILKYTNIFDPESIAGALNLAGGRTGEGARIRGKDISALTPEDFAKTQDPYYSGLERMRGGGLLEELISGFKKITGGIGRGSGGGMAGSGGLISDILQGKDKYKRGFADILADIEGRKAQALGNVQDKIQAFVSLIQ